MSDFAATVREFAVKAKDNMDKDVRGITLALFSSVINLSPVGRPELWASNRVAVEYNAQVQEHNAALRSDPANLDKRGRLKRGRKLNDGMDIVAPAGYVGGRFRANWNTSVSAPDETTTEDVDPTGAKATANVLAKMGGAGKVTYLTNALPYAERLEYSAWSKQAPAGMVRVSMARIDAIVSELK
jgi:hypothetical protein